jgi:protein involved in polysaccharide export with SLBB domain
MRPLRSLALEDELLPPTAPRPGARPRDRRLAPGLLLHLLPLLLLAIVSLPAHGQSPPVDPRTESSALPPVSTTSPQASGSVVPGTLRNGPEAQEGAIDPERYVLGPGDELSLDLLGRLNLSQRLVVDPEGELWIPDFGRVRAAGRTLAQLRDDLKRRFRGSSRGIDVHVRLLKLRRMKAYVSGDVRSPGVIDVPAGTRVSEAIERAGGFLDTGSRRNIALRGIDGTARTADLVRFERLGDRDANPALADGDQVSVPRRSDYIYLYAPAPYPGQYEFREGDDLASLVRIGGGFLPGTLLERASLVRFEDPAVPETLAIDLAAALDGGPKITLRAGDRLFVPRASRFREDRHVTVSGEVARPGLYPLTVAPLRVSDALAAAGGLTPLAAAHAVLVVRRSETALERDPEFDRLSRLSRPEMTSSEYLSFRTKLASAQTTFLVDATALEPGGTRDVVLQPDDVVVVDRVSSSVRVSGVVRRPGLVLYAPALNGDDYIRLAGGYAKGASRSATRVTRAANGETLRLGEVERIEPGDLIYVPDKPDRNLFAALRDVIVVAGAIATVVIAFR